MKVEENKVSIIVPIYNTEKYLEKCLDSIKNQTHRNIEIILVNDGSTDSSENIILTFIAREPRAIYIAQPNQGVSVARNTGIARASGRYVLFCDSDDYYPKRAIETLITRATIEAADIVIGNYYKKSKLRKKLIKVAPHKSPKAFLESLVTGINHGGPCTKMFSRQILQDIFFRPGIKFREDLLFLVEVLLKQPRLSYVQDPIYVYLKRKGSTVNSIDQQALKSSVLVSIFLESKLEGEIPFSSLEKMRAIDAYSIIVNSRKALSKHEVDLHLQIANKASWSTSKKIALLLSESRLHYLIGAYKQLKRRFDNLISY
ncbi:glycosyltransferase [Stutzerimonas chloritidismutans]|uniref:glycosyltransferase family 2 protein n=1 Tax=Stutzerimonas chloritidismutans TaxID=203192 RepID=UPI00385099EB